MRQTIFKKSYIVHTLLIPFSLAIVLVSVPSASALSYQTDVGINFTFNPTLSISLSPNNLTIPNLPPGTTDTSNEILINVSTNNVYGYNLYATVGNETHNNTNFTHTNNTDVFSSIPTTANLPTLTTDNTWGYTYSLDNGTTWSNYNGLPLYTTDNPTRLKKNTGPSNDTINFKIATKAGSTQPSGIYTNIINFTAITKPTPITLADAYAKEGKELYKGYYKMQDMTPTICEETEDIGAQLQVIDIRDDKVYWISKLKDNHCWMTQNLDLDIDDTRTYTHYDTDLGWTTGDETATWKPTEGHSTINFTGTTVDGWVDSNTEPYSANKTDDSKTDHDSLGNYYNWSAAVASNNTDSFSGNADNSVCPNRWRLPNANKTEIRELLLSQDIIGVDGKYLSDGFTLLREHPLYFVLAGIVGGKPGTNGYYWSSTVTSDKSRAHDLRFFSFRIDTEYGGDNKSYGLSLRCLAR